MIAQGLYHTFKRYRTLQTHRIQALPVVILMPHSACNCRCVMCDIWKDNKNLKQLNEQDITGLLHNLRQLGTQRILMSGGEALLNTNFFTLCRLLKMQGIKITLLSTGLSVARHAADIVKWVDDLILSLDGDEALHDAIRDIPGAFRKLREGVEQLRTINPQYPITARTVIHRLNFRSWPAILKAAQEIGIDQVSFLPADVSSHAFNRQVAWSEPKQHEILPGEQELDELKAVVEQVIAGIYPANFIAEKPGKLREIHRYYAAFYGHNSFPFKKCNAPWVSAVIEADGRVRPCFFHEATGNIRQNSLIEILNGTEALNFRKTLNMGDNATCEKCVCALNLSPLTKLN